MSNISSTDRKEAKQSIINHFTTLLECDVDEKEVAARKLKAVKVDHKTNSKKVADAYKHAKDLQKKLQKELGAGFEVDECGKISVEWRGDYAIARDEKLAIQKKNKPIMAKRKRALSKLQVISTREELKALFETHGIL